MIQANWLEFCRVFDKSKSFVLATIVDTKGSTYQKTGAMMLVDKEGTCFGLLSGGCLEADISLHAKTVLDNNENKLLTYDLKADADLLWGLGLGCEGALDILLTPLTPENNHQDFGELLNSVGLHNSGIYYLPRTVSETKKSPTAHFSQAQFESLSGLKQCLTESFISEEDAFVAIPVLPPLSILICGAGPDAEPLVKMCVQQGWKVVLWDHRKGYLQQSGFESAHEKRKIRAEKVTSDDYSNIDATVIMTHNLESDEQYLQASIAANVNYIGLLGPIARRKKLLENLNVDENEIAGQVYGPVGLDLGGRGPAAIALSIAAEIQQHFSDKFKLNEIKPIKL